MLQYRLRGGAVQAESKLQARQVSAWQELPNELLYKVCQQLELKDLLAAHACCSDWYHMLRHPKAPGIWGDIEICLDTLPILLDKYDNVYELAGNELCLPTSTWLWHRAPGISSLKLRTQQCLQCEMKEAPCHKHACKDGARVETLLAVLLAPLIDKRIDLRIELLCRSRSHTVWPATRPPHLQHLLSNNLISLHLASDIDAHDLFTICTSFSRLTSLEVRLASDDEATESAGVAVAAVASLTSLYHLSLEHSSDETWSHLDWSPLQQLTSLKLSWIDPGSTVAATVTNLKHLHLYGSAEWSAADKTAVHKLSSLTSLEVLTVDQSPLLDEMCTLPHLPRLQELDFIDLEEDYIESFPGGSEGYHHALGRVTQLTRLHISGCSFDSLQAGHLQNLAQIRDLCLQGLEITDFAIPQTWCNLTSLDISSNRLTRVPHNITCLTLLVRLVLDEQDADFQLTEPMHFLTALTNLRCVSMEATAEYPYNFASLCAGAHGQLLIKHTLGCHVKLEFK